jgi:hypothetical protein
VKWQRYEWSCGAATVVNALRCFGIKVDERKVIPVAGTTPPSRCAHCRNLQELVSKRTCKRSKWKCKCSQCKIFRSANRKDCDSGTAEEGIVAAIRYFGENRIIGLEYQQEDKDHAWQWLHGSLFHGNAAILCVDSWNHWVVATAGPDDRVMIFDPYASKKNKAENMIDPVDRTELMRRWWNGRKWAGKDRRLYAVLVGRKKKLL